MDIGDIAPDFTLPDETGAERKLTDLLNDGPVVLFFYPMAMTAGCTAEACHFRDLAGELGELGASPVGISTDDVSKQAEFASKHSLGYPLLSDTEGEVAAEFGVKRKISALPSKRKTFVIDTDRKVIGVAKSEVKMNAHADHALAVLRERKNA
ncbi:peroxiredoxin [Glycomyces sp. L485]|uniref:peroxiredoxin n=1 Tax=Glycomyces sp. L485 TaxID=2909235 RepID=UPI001F4B8CBC|nr:peroxiredoxin [Glycomyces sp. L485]MCH7230667.1 peroxiredoxin [Glycomyces sp. L485]